MLNSVNFKLTSACVIGGVMALATSARALTGGVAPKVSAAATASPSSISDGADDNSNPYTIIVDRNVFRLNPPPPPHSAADDKPVELPKVNLNGIIKVGNDVRVLFSIPAKDAKSQISYFKLAPGEKDDVLELVKIHSDQQAVDVLVSGTAMTLSMASNSLASTGGKAAGGPPAPGPAAPPAPTTPAAATATSGGSSAIVLGRDRSSSSRGGITVAGGDGGGITTIGGNSGAKFTSSGGGVSVSGGGSGIASPSFNTSSGQIANTLVSGTQASDVQARQAADMIVYSALHNPQGAQGANAAVSSPLLPPPVAAALGALSGEGSGDSSYTPPPPPPPP
jgi:hypothetical protein